jgi:hypothetical protein
LIKHLEIGWIVVNKQQRFNFFRMIGHPLSPG